MAAPIALSVAIVVVSILSLGFYDQLTNFEENGCHMTWMFEQPKYKELSFKEEEKDFPHYRLYLYGEGSYYDSFSTVRITGIPVLFIPGNAGSHKQVRSLASVALRKAQDRIDGNHFNYFVAGFDEELSALSGSVLKRQTEFVQRCVTRILSLYRHMRSPPKTVVLIGHSMGGFIARAIFTIPGFDPSTVHTIITQATPHQRPLTFVDAATASFYNSVNDFWRKKSGTALRHVTMVSTGGGFRDYQVRYDQTPLTGIVDPSRSISALTSAVPNAWVSTDHQCAVWCRQMVFATQRALFNLIDLQTQQIYTDADKRMKVFRHHFISNNGLKDYLSHEDNETVKLDGKIKWETKLDSLWRVQIKKTKISKYIAMPVSLEEGKDSVLILSNLTNGEWVCYCDIPEGKDRCSSCTSLSGRSRLLPPLMSNSKYVRVNRQDIPITNNTHIVVIVPKGEEMVSIQADRYNMDERHLIYHLPNTYDSIISYPIWVTDGAAMLKVSNASSFYSLHLAGMALPTNTYMARVTPMACRKHHAEDNEGSVLRLNVPWSVEETYAFAGYNKEVSLPIKLQTGRPTGFDREVDSMEPHLEMFLHPYCQYQVRLLVSTKDTLGQFVRFYGLLLPAFFMAVWMLTLRGALSRSSRFQATHTSDSSPSEALFEYAKPYYIMPMLLVIRFVTGLSPVSRLLSKLGLPKDDADLVQEQNIWFRLLPVLLYLAAWMFSYVHCFVAHHMMALFSYLGKVLALLPSSLFKLLTLMKWTVCILAVSSCIFCGSLGIFMSNFLLIMNVLYISYVICCNLDTKETHRSLLVVFSLMMLTTWTSLLTLPSLITWFKQLAITHQLQPLDSDPVKVAGFVISFCVTVFINTKVAKPSQLQGEMIGAALYVLSILALLYCMDSVYRIPMVTCVVLVLAVLPNLISRVHGAETEKDRDE